MKPSGRKILIAVGGSPRRLFGSPLEVPIVLKDILRVGRWQLDHGVWNVTPKTLHELARQFRRCKRNKVRIPWIWNHEGGAQDRIGDVEDVWVSGGTLYARMSIQESRHLAHFGARRGEKSPQEVSVEVTEDFIDGKGRHYPIALTHVACVLHPVIPGQGPFYRLSYSQGEPAMSSVNESKPAANPSKGDKSGEAEVLPIGEVIELINEYFAAGVSTEIQTAKELRATLDAMADERAELSEEELPPILGDEGTDSEGVSVASLRRMLEESRRRLALAESRRVEDERSAFLSELDRLVGENRITPAFRKEIAAIADKNKVFSLSLLTPYRALPEIALPIAHRSTSSNRGGGPNETGSPDAARRRLFQGMGLTD